MRDFSDCVPGDTVVLMFDHQHSSINGWKRGITLTIKAISFNQNTCLVEESNIHFLNADECGKLESHQSKNPVLSLQEKILKAKERFKLYYSREIKELSIEEKLSMCRLVNGYKGLQFGVHGDTYYVTGVNLNFWSYHLDNVLEKIMWSV